MFFFLLKLPFKLLFTSCWKYSETIVRRLVLVGIAGNNRATTVCVSETVVSIKWTYQWPSPPPQLGELRIETSVKSATEIHVNQLFANSGDWNWLNWRNTRTSFYVRNVTHFHQFHQFLVLFHEPNKVSFDWNY